MRLTHSFRTPRTHRKAPAIWLACALVAGICGAGCGEQTPPAASNASSNGAPSMAQGGPPPYVAAQQNQSPEEQKQNALKAREALEKRRQAGK